MELIRQVIDGVEIESLSGATFETTDPWTREPYARVALGDAADADRAVSAARRAFDSGPWPRMGFAERGALLHRLADLVLAHGEELALADTRDMGKPISDALGKDVPRTAQNFRFFADHARMAAAEALPMDTGHHAYANYPPAGVVVAIAPWNFPLMLESWKVAPALAWGNTVVLKPAEDSPASATLLARLALEAGIPPGVLNVVHGYGPDSVGAALTEHRAVDRITFTGESGTGRAIARAASANLVPVSLELGGKGANLVFDDCDLANAVDWSIRAIFTNAGQVCLAGSRLYVQRGVYDEFVDRFTAAARALVVGDPKDKNTQLGPLASAEHFAKVSSYLDDLSAGASGRVLTGGAADAGTWVVRPTVVVEAPADARVCREEVFGPVVAIHPFDTEDEAIALANDTRYGLNAMLFTENLSRAHRVSARLRAGTVWVNCFFVRDLRAPFGGVGDSGVGREGGTFSREFFTEPQAVVMQIAR
jgi:aminomuconate-semialdehyde/2-hydroxymuconate-6-semialdehyde dehydrogenase